MSLDQIPSETTAFYRDKIWATVTNVSGEYMFKMASQVYLDKKQEEYSFNSNLIHVVKLFECYSRLCGWK